jgi:hypothetical protein
MGFGVRGWATLFAAALVSVGCSSASSSAGSGGSGAGGSGGLAFGGAAGSGGSGGIDVDGGSGGSLTGCSAATQFVYVIDNAGVLYKFDPPSLAFTQVGPINCPTSMTPFSMAVDRNANAWVVFTDGQLYQVDTTTAACKTTGFAAEQHGFKTFGMGFSTAGPGSTVDTLFVSQASDLGTTTGLATIDTQTLTLNPIGMYDQINARAELTGTGDGKLYGAFEGAPYIVAEIQKLDAKILTQAPQQPVQSTPGGSNFAFAFWGGTFWLFVGQGFSTDVFNYDPLANTTLQKTTVSQVIVGAGVSTCAPIKPPA